jgi:hypothetical protein
MYTSDEDEADEEDEFVNIDDDDDKENSIPSILGGSFSIPSRGEKPKRVKWKESWVFNHCFRVIRKGVLYWKYNLCKNQFLSEMRIYSRSNLGNSTTDMYEFGESIFTLKHGSSSAGKHLRGPKHNLQSNGQPKPVFTTDSVHSQLVTGSLLFSPEVFRGKLLRFIAVLHMSFRIVERDKFRDLMLYASPHLRHDSTLLKSGGSISLSLVTAFLACQTIFISMLQSCGTTVHLSFDLWTSPNKYAFLGVVCHFIDSQWQARTVLLAMKPLYGSHAGVNMAQLVIHVIQCYGIHRLLGYCVMDNEPDNDTTLREISSWLSSEKAVFLDADKHGLRCFGHPRNLVRINSCSLGSLVV